MYFATAAPHCITRLYVLQELYKSASIFLTGPVQAVHQYIDMSNQNVVLNSTHNVTTCKPAMGFSFAAGTTDGPGAFNFKQGLLTANHHLAQLTQNFCGRGLKACQCDQEVCEATCRPLHGTIFYTLCTVNKVTVR